MRRNKTMIFAFAATFTVIFAVAVFLIFSYRTERTASVVLPTPAQSDTQGGSYDTSGGEALKVTEDNVQAVISTLKRPDTYYQELSVISAWDGGQTEYSVSAWAKQGAVRTSVKSRVMKYAKETILTPDKLYVWYAGDTGFYSGRPGDRPNADGLQMIPTYEDVLKLDKAAILDAGYTKKNAESCIFVRALSKDTGYIDVFYISAETGLLYAAETLDGERLVYSMTANGVTLTIPTDDRFLLPDGTSAIA